VNMIMQPAPSGVVAVLVQLWARIYTFGLPDGSRQRRLDQITSDLWEHFEDRRLDGISPALISLEALERAARGVIADFLWRFQLEGPQMQLNFPLQRVGGACLLILVGAVMLNVSADGYDAAATGFDGELRRLAEITDWQVQVYTVLQVLAGIGMIGGACLVYVYLSNYARVQALLASVALAGAGLLALVTSAFYMVTAELADEYVLAAPERAESVLVTARGSMLMMSALIGPTILLLAIAVLGFAAITGRHHLVPRWLGFVAGGVSLVIPALVIAVAAGADTTSWILSMIGLLLMLLWLVVAGGWLLLGGSRTDGSSGLQAPAIAPSTSA
jgi:hypothetical protein